MLFVKPDDTLKQAGDLVRNLQLADTLMTLSLEGVQTFYTGDIAQILVNATVERGNYSVYHHDLLQLYLKEYYEIVDEARPLSGFFPTHADCFTEMHF